MARGVNPSRRGVDCIDLLQFHWWHSEHPGYLDAMLKLNRLHREGLIAHLGVTNFDTGHLRLPVRHGIPVVSNQVSFSVVDRRPAGDMSAFCLENNIALPCYGSLCGGFLSERWIRPAEPAEGQIADWSKAKYLRFINAAVAAIIVGARPGEREHRDENLAVFGFSLDDEDARQIAAAADGAEALPGDCGDAYRRPPVLTASGDLSHHVASLPGYYTPQRLEAGPTGDRLSTHGN